jgi:hypothetical protein
MNMSLATLAWLGMAAYAFHILEEFMLDWRGWSHAVLGLKTEWRDFYVTNCIVVALGIAQAMLAPTLPLAVLSYTGLQLINGFFLHLVPFIRTGGRFSPGLVTSVILFFPLSITTFWTALSTGLASSTDILLALIIGALTMAFPVVMLLARDRPYFRQMPTPAAVE